MNREERIREMIQTGRNFMRPEKMAGSDLIENGMKPGKEIGAVLSKLLEIVIENPEYNTKDKLLEIYKQL